jgi:hypothetical protein
MRDIAAGYERLAQRIEQQSGDADKGVGPCGRAGGPLRRGTIPKRPCFVSAPFRAVARMVSGKDGGNRYR